MNDPLGDRMKLYEGAEADRRLMPLLPVLARIDGRCFSSFTLGLERPFDVRLSQAMEETTRWLVRETAAAMGYTQSDEITLAWHSDSLKHKIFFDGRVSKIVSQLAAMASVKFLRYVDELLPPEYGEKLPTFDARVWCVPNRTEAANCFLWRERDATKNSISMAAQSLFRPRDLHGKNSSQMQEMLFQEGINWNDYPAFFKRGVFIQRRDTSEPFTAEELEALPPLHQARTNPGLVVVRSKYVTLDMPPFGQVTNREAVIFDRAEPVLSCVEEASPCTCS